MQINQKKNARSRRVKLMIVMATVIVVAIIVVLAVVAVPGYTAAIRSARESVLNEDLHVLRDGIHSYTADKKKPPQSLGDLLAAGYLKQIPEDPMTHGKETWVTETTADLHSLKAQAVSGGIDDVHSGSQEQGSNGRPYSTW
jgi:general secretion pathway protein G